MKNISDSLKNEIELFIRSHKCNIDYFDGSESNELKYYYEGQNSILCELAWAFEIEDLYNEEE